jgi:hypothetical protein
MCGQYFLSTSRGEEKGAIIFELPACCATLIALTRNVMSPQVRFLTGDVRVLKGRVNHKHEYLSLFAFGFYPP